MEDVAESSQPLLHNSMTSITQRRLSSIRADTVAEKVIFHDFFFQRNYNVEQFSIQTRNFYNNFQNSIHSNYGIEKEKIKKSQC